MTDASRFIGGFASRRVSFNFYYEAGGNQGWRDVSEKYILPRGGR